MGNNETRYAKLLFSDSLIKHLITNFNIKIKYKLKAKQAFLVYGLNWVNTTPRRFSLSAILWFGSVFGIIDLLHEPSVC